MLARPTHVFRGVELQKYACGYRLMLFNVSSKFPDLSSETYTAVLVYLLSQPDSKLRETQTLFSDPRRALEAVLDWCFNFSIEESKEMFTTGDLILKEVTNQAVNAESPVPSVLLPPDPKTADPAQL